MSTPSLAKWMKFKETVLSTFPCGLGEYRTRVKAKNKRAMGQVMEALRASIEEGPRTALTSRATGRHPAPEGTRSRDAANVRQHETYQPTYGRHWRRWGP